MPDGTGTWPSAVAGRYATSRHSNIRWTDYGTVIELSAVSPASVALRDVWRSRLAAAEKQIEKRDPDLCLGRVGASLPLRASPPGIAVR